MHFVLWDNPRIQVTLDCVKILCNNHELPLQRSVVSNPWIVLCPHSAHFVGGSKDCAINPRIVAQSVNPRFAQANPRIARIRTLRITSIYIFENVCLFVCLFAVNAKTTERIDAKRSEITKNYPESVLCGLKSPVLVFSGRYGYISGFSFAADRYFYLSSFHFRLLLRRLTQSASQTQQNYDTN